MKYADMVGLPQIWPTSSLRQGRPAVLEPSPLLVELVERGASFDSLNQAG
jgi:3-hydroxyacyl-CoA dehydrogenase